MGIFFKRKRTKPSWPDLLREKLQWKVAYGLHSVQGRWAAFMHRQTERLSRKGQKIMVCCFLALGNAYCSFLICKGLLTNEAVRPKLPEIQSSVRIDPGISSGITEPEVLRVLHFKRYLDSLSKSPDGSQYYHELIRRRPGLIDSLNAFEIQYGAVESNAVND